MAWGQSGLPKAWCDLGCNLCHECGENVYHLKDLSDPQHQNSGMAAKTNTNVTRHKHEEAKLCLKTFSNCLSEIRCQKFSTEAKGSLCQKDAKEHQSDKKGSEACTRFDLFEELAGAKDACERNDRNHPLCEVDPYSGADLRNSPGHQTAGKSHDHGEITYFSYQDTSEKVHSRDNLKNQERARETNVKSAVREALHQEFGKEAYARVEEELSKETYSIQDLQFLCDLLDISEKFNKICRRNIPFHELSSLIFETWATKNDLHLNANHLKQILRSRPVFKPLLRILEESQKPSCPPRPARPPPRLPPRRRLYAESSPPAPPAPPRTATLPEALTRPTTTTRPSRSRSPGLPPPRISHPPSSPPPLPPLPGVFEPLPQGAVSASRILQVVCLPLWNPVVIIMCRLPLWGASL